MIFSINKRFTNIVIYVIIIYVKLYSEALRGQAHIRAA